MGDLKGELSKAFGIEPEAPEKQAGLGFTKEKTDPIKEPLPDKEIGSRFKEGDKVKFNGPITNVRFHRGPGGGFSNRIYEKQHLVTFDPKWTVEVEVPSYSDTGLVLVKPINLDEAEAKKVGESNYLIESKFLTKQ